MRCRFWLALLLLALAVTTPRAQEALTSKQRIADLEQLAALYAKNYAPYEWKRDVIGFDLLRLTPWLQRIHHAGDVFGLVLLREAAGGACGKSHAAQVRHDHGVVTR